MGTLATSHQSSTGGTLATAGQEHGGDNKITTTDHGSL